MVWTWILLVAGVLLGRPCQAISRGVFAKSNSFPNVCWLDSTAKPDILICQATLLSPKFLITSCDCARAFSGSTIRVHCGDHDISVAGEPCEQLRPVKEVVTCDRTTNMALLKLDRKMDTDKTHPVTKAKCVDYFLPDCSATAESLVGQLVNVIGWGSSSAGGELSGPLRFTTIKIVNPARCKRRSPVHICARGKRSKEYGYQGPCFGDAGGAMMKADTLIGITVSHPQGCRENKKFSHYLLLSKMCSAIYEKVGCDLTKYGKWTKFYNTDTPSDGKDIENTLQIRPCGNIQPLCAVCRQSSRTRCNSHQRRCQRRKHQRNTCSILGGSVCEDDKTSVLAGRHCQCCDYEVKFLCPV